MASLWLSLIWLGEEVLTGGEGYEKWVFKEEIWSEVFEEGAQPRNGLSEELLPNPQQPGLLFCNSLGGQTQYWWSKTQILVLCELIKYVCDLNKSLDLTGLDFLLEKWGNWTCSRRDLGSVLAVWWLLSWGQTHCSTMPQIVDWYQRLLRTLWELWILPRVGLKFHFGFWSTSKILTISRKKDWFPGPTS